MILSNCTRARKWYLGMGIVRHSNFLFFQLWTKKIGTGHFFSMLFRKNRYASQAYIYAGLKNYAFRCGIIQKIRVSCRSASLNGCRTQDSNRYLFPSRLLSVRPWTFPDKAVCISVFPGCWISVLGFPTSCGCSGSHSIGFSVTHQEARASETFW